ncbi:MAG: hypothetical protein JXA20_14335 [Spirochaetes bacterium]|nr:hypothetical protein [Spirochaetota bacterium]
MSYHALPLPGEPPGSGNSMQFQCITYNFTWDTTALSAPVPQLNIAAVPVTVPSYIFSSMTPVFFTMQPLEMIFTVFSTAAGPVWLEKKPPEA